MLVNKKIPERVCLAVGFSHCLVSPLRFRRYGHPLFLGEDLHSTV